MISEQPPGRNQSKPLLAILGIFTICAGVSALIFSGYWLNRLLAQDTLGLDAIAQCSSCPSR
jgi:hypothetical protein